MNLPSLPSLPTAGAAAPPGPPSVDGPLVELAVGGMHCASCVSRIESALAKVPGVSLAVVDLLSGRASVRLSEVRYFRLSVMSMLKSKLGNQ